MGRERKGSIGRGGEEREERRKGAEGMEGEPNIEPWIRQCFMCNLFQVLKRIVIRRMAANTCRRSQITHTILLADLHKLYAVKILRLHRMIDTVLHQVYKSVILSKLQYASYNAWRGFTKASDRQRIDNFIRQSVKSGFCGPTIFRRSL